MVSAQQAEIEHLKLIIAKFRRMQFGRRSEQMDDAIAQLELSLEELECIRAEQQASDKTAHSARKRVKSPRQNLGASPCLIICRENQSNICHRMTAARTVAVP